MDWLDALSVSTYCQYQYQYCRVETLFPSTSQRADLLMGVCAKCWHLSSSHLVGRSKSPAQVRQFQYLITRLQWGMLALLWSLPLRRPYYGIYSYVSYSYGS